MNRPLEDRWFSELAKALGYDAQYVLSIRLRKDECWVTYSDEEGHLRTNAHDVIPR